MLGVIVPLMSEISTDLLFSIICDSVTAVPVTPNIVLPSAIFEDIRPESPFIVCTPLKYCPDVIVWSARPGVYVASPLLGIVPFILAPLA